MEDLRKLGKNLTERVQGTVRRVEDTITTIKGTISDAELRGIEMAAQLAYQPAGVLLDAYHMPTLLGLTTGREVQLLQSLTAAELGRQVNEPLLHHITNQIPLPSSETSENQSTAVVPVPPVSGDRRVRTTSDIAVGLIEGLGSHFIRSASRRFEEALPEIIKNDKGIDSEERERLLRQLPLLKEVAERFVGAIAGDAQNLLTVIDRRTMQNLINRHIEEISRIAEDYSKKISH